ncbi:hypothetical protein R1flu_000226 [Riccia fluitans]|uniref:EF-hand domain-containing protein n=1 Tax=Riccia fluitans TaxID=41844 RepID=A0ABD1XZU8_9MARC
MLNCTSEGGHIVEDFLKGSAENLRVGGEPFPQQQTVGSASEERREKNRELRVEESRNQEMGVESVQISKAVGTSRRPTLQVRVDSVPQQVSVPVSRIDSVDRFLEDLGSERTELRRVFAALDEDQDNLICVTDLRHFMAKLGSEVSEEEAVAMVATVDKNGDGKVTLDEFCDLYQHSLNNVGALSEGEESVSDEDDSIHQAFRVFDKNGDGFITAKELQVVLLGMGRPEGKSLQNCERMIRGVNTDGTGRVDIHRFKYLMSPKFYH